MFDMADYAQKLRNAFRWNASCRVCLPYAAGIDTSAAEKAGCVLICGQAEQLQLARESGFTPQRLLYTAEPGYEQADAYAKPHIPLLQSAAHAHALLTLPFASDTVFLYGGDADGIDTDELLYLLLQLHCAGSNWFGLHNRLGILLDPVAAATELFRKAALVCREMGLFITNFLLPVPEMEERTMQERSKGIQSAFEEILQPAGLGESVLWIACV